MKNIKKCDDDKELNPYTNRCVKKCPINKTRKKNDDDKSFKCVPKNKIKLRIEESDEETKQVQQTKQQSSKSDVSFTSTPKDSNPINLSSLIKSKSSTTHTSSPKKISRSIKSTSSILGDPCKDYLELLEERKKTNLQINLKNRECEEIKFGSIQKYFNKEEPKTTCKDLLIALQKMYISARTTDPNYSLYFHIFVWSVFMHMAS